MSVEEQKSNVMGKRCLFTVLCVAIYACIVGIVISIGAFTDALSGKLDVYKGTQVVFYEGPKTLADATEDDLKTIGENKRDFTIKHCVDTKVKVNGTELYVYDTNVNNGHTWSSDGYPVQSRTPVTYFDFDGKVEIEVDVPDIDIEKVVVRPLAYEIKPEVDKANHTVKFTIDKNDQYTVEFNDSAKRAVHIFANELDTIKETLDFSQKNVKYIGPGEWNIDAIVLEDGDTVYVDGGAVVHGQIIADNATSVKIYGRGIIDGSTFKTWMHDTAKVPLSFNSCKNVNVDGIILLNPNAWCVQLYDTVLADINNLKIISSRPNGDGISVQSSKDVTVTNSFVRTWDDSLVVKNYNNRNSKNVVFKDIQIWTDLAQSMEVGFETNKGQNPNSPEISDVVFENITVLHNYHKPVVSVHNGDDANVHDITFKNIVVEDAKMGTGDGVNHLVEIQVVFNPNWSHTKQRGTINNVVIDGLKVINTRDELNSVIEGFDADHGVDGVTFKNVNFLGKDITSVEEGKITVNKKTVKNVKFE